jgi:hypothetical protein
MGDADAVAKSYSTRGVNEGYRSLAGSVGTGFEKASLLLGGWAVMRVPHSAS